ncbi:MAG TPA: hypothetical protein VGG02_02275 [Chthoniobacterales bacterium]|jgi:hypothetical protein
MTALHWKLTAGFVIVFIAGLAAGNYFGQLQAHNHHGEMAHRRSLAERMRVKMEARLELTPEQVKATAPIFDRTATQLETIRIETGRRVHAVLDQSDRELRPQLTDEQRAKLTLMETERDAALNARVRATHTPSP